MYAVRDADAVGVMTIVTVAHGHEAVNAMSLANWIIVTALTLAVVNLPLGWLLGRRRGRGDAPGPARPGPDMRDLHDVAQRLAEQVADVNRDVNQYQGRMEQVNRELLDARPDEPGHLAQSVLASVAEILASTPGCRAGC